MKNSNLLINTALASTFFEKNRNYFDIYLPFIINVFDSDDNKEFDINKISDKLKSNNIELPINSLKNIIYSNKNYFNIRKEGKNNLFISLLENTKNLKDSFNKEEKALSREIDKFYTSFKDYAKNKYKSEYDDNTIKRNINKFLKTHLLKTIVFITKINDRFEYQDIDKEFDKRFIHFLKECQDDNNLVLEKLCRGFILLNELKNYKSLSKKPSSFSEKLSVSLDTNIIFSLLKLHNPIINQATKELFELIKEHQNIKPYVTSKTINEFNQLLDNYDYAKNDFSGIEVDSVFWYMKEKHYGSTQILKLKEEIINILENDHGIRYLEIEDWNDKYNNYYTDINDQLEQDRKRRHSQSTETDIINICHVLINKNIYTDQINNVKNIFLTSSYTLYNSYKKIKDIKSKEKYPSVILDVHLTNVLYRHSSKNKGLTINGILKNHSGYFIVNKDIWKKYIEVLKTLLQDGNIEYKDYARLINNKKEIENTLIEADINSIDKEKIDTLLEKVKKNETEKDKNIATQEDKIKFLEEENKRKDYIIYQNKENKFIDDKIKEEWENKKRDGWFLLSFLNFIPILSKISKYLLPEEKIKESYKLLFKNTNYKNEFSKNKRKELEKNLLNYSKWKNKNNEQN